MSSDDSRYPFVYRVPNIPAPGVRTPLGAHALFLESDAQGRFMGYQHFGRVIETSSKVCWIDVDGQRYMQPWQNVYLQAIGPELEGLEFTLDRLRQMKIVTEALQKG